MSMEYHGVPWTTMVVCCQCFELWVTVTEFYGIPRSFRRYLGVYRGLYVRGVLWSTVEYRRVCCQYFEACLTVTEFYGVPLSFRRYLGVSVGTWGGGGWGGFRYLGVYKGLYVRGFPGSTGEYREYRGVQKVPYKTTHIMKVSFIIRPIRRKCVNFGILFTIAF